jgi:hypothetical protein
VLLQQQGQLPATLQLQAATVLVAVQAAATLFRAKLVAALLQ